MYSIACWDPIKVMQPHSCLRSTVLHSVIRRMGLQAADWQLSPMAGCNTNRSMRQESTLQRLAEGVHLLKGQLEADVAHLGGVWSQAAAAQRRAVQRVDPKRACVRRGWWPQSAGAIKLYMQNNYAHASCKTQGCATACRL